MCLCNGYATGSFGLVDLRKLEGESQMNKFLRSLEEGEKEDNGFHCERRNC